MTTVRKFRELVAAAALSLALAPVLAGSAIASDKLALSVLAFVHSIDASPYWSAQMRGLEVDEQHSTVTIGSLIVAAERGGIVVKIDDATLAGYAATADGGFTAASLAIGHVAIATTATKATFADVRFDKVEVPALSGIAYDPATPFTSLIGAYVALAKTRNAGGRIAEIGIHEDDSGQSSVIAYQNVVFGPLTDGKLESASAGPLNLQSPASDPLAELKVQRAEAKGIDFGAFAHVLDPLSYIAGVGDGQWRHAVDQVRYTDITLNVPSIQLTIGTIAVDGVKLRQPAENFAPLIDAITRPRAPTPIAMDALRSTYLPKLLSAFGVGQFAVDDVAVSATGIDQLSLGSFKLSGASSDSLGQIGFQNFVAAIAGQGAAQIGHFALGDVVLPSFGTFDEALKVAQAGGNVDVSSLAPKIGSLEVGGIHLQTIDFPGLALGRLRADFDNYVGTVPTGIAVDVNDFDVATASLPNAGLRNLVAGLGYERIGGNASLKLNWHEPAGTVSLDDFEVDITDFGNATATVVLDGLTRRAIEKGNGGALLDGLRFERARLTFEDRSVVDRSLSMRADLLNIPLARLKQQLSGALPLMLAVLGESAKAMVPVLQEFIKSPGTLTIEAAPQSPVPIAEIENAARSRPQSLPGLLSISLSGTPGGEAADNATANVPVPGDGAPGPTGGAAASESP